MTESESEWEVKHEELPPGSNWADAKLVIERHEEQGWAHYYAIREAIHPRDGAPALEDVGLRDLVFWRRRRR